MHAVDGQWKRVYRIRLIFEDLVKIKETFGVNFEVISWHLSMVVLRAVCLSAGDDTHALLSTLQMLYC